MVLTALMRFYYYSLGTHKKSHTIKLATTSKLSFYIVH